MKHFLNNYKYMTMAVVYIFMTHFCSLTYAAEKMTVNKIKGLVKSHPSTQKPIKSIEELLSVLPKSLLSNFTFVYESRSPFKESISHEYPRVILFTPDTRLIMTFTGHPEKSGYNILEMIEFDDKKSEFNFYAMDLDSDRKPASKNLDSKSCKECHGNDPRPINDSYPIWQGFYGSVLDSFSPSIEHTKNEGKEFKSFFRKNSKKGVYKYLNYAKGSSVTPYLDPKLLKLDSLGRATHHDVTHKPNERFGIAMTALNKKRIFRKMKSSPLYESNKKNILYEFLGCGRSAVRQKRVDEIAELVKKENEERIRRMKISPKNRNVDLVQMQELKMLVPLAKIDWMTDKLKMSREDWSLAMEKNSLSFFDGILSGRHNEKNLYLVEDLIFEMLQDLSKQEEAYKPYFKVGYNLGHYLLPFVDKIDWDTALRSCKQLKKDKLKRFLSSSKKSK